MPDGEPDISTLADEVIAQLEPGTVIDDKLILSRRQAIALATGTLSLGALGGFATGDAQAQTAAGQVGTSSEPVDVHAHDLNEADLQNASSGTVPTAQGDGTMAMDSVGGGLWQEDPNSPFTISAASSGTFTPSGSYDYVRFVINHGAGSDEYEADQVRINGDTGANYDYMTIDGTYTSGATGFETDGANRYFGWTLTDSSIVGLAEFHPLSASANNLQSGNIAAVSGGLDSVTVASDSGNSFSFEARVYGATI